MFKVSNLRTDNKVSDKALNLSSNLSTCLDRWEQIMRVQNRIFGSSVTRNYRGLITNIEFFYNDFLTVSKGNQYIKWVNVTLVDV